MRHCQHPEMTTLPSRLRACLHLILALVLLVQAATALALGTGHARALAQPDVPESSAVLAATAAEPDAAALPCHPAVPDPAPEPVKGCCPLAASGLCTWACTFGSVPLPVLDRTPHVPLAVSSQLPPMTVFRSIALPVELRPPIA